MSSIFGDIRAAMDLNFRETFDGKQGLSLTGAFPNVNNNFDSAVSTLSFQSPGM